jgi:hypothetical protein
MLKFTQRYGSELLTFVLVAQLPAAPVADKNPHIGEIFAVFVLIILLAGAGHSGDGTRDRILLISLTSAWITMRLCEALDNGCQIFAHLAPVSGLLLSYAVRWMILDRFGTIPNVTASVISEAFLIYLVIAIAFSQLYSILNPILLNPFNQVVQPWKASTLLYFSMITLSSVGYGGIVPVNPYFRLVAALESMIGIFYIAVVVARLVSSYRPRINMSGA